jgi:large-conductance mechanosensitive channel
MTNEWWIFAIVTFLFVLSVKKYNCLDSLREWIEEYLAEISPQETVEEEDIVALEEIRDMIEDYVIRNPQIFSNLNNKKDE